MINIWNSLIQLSSGRIDIFDDELDLLADQEQTRKSQPGRITKQSDLPAHISQVEQLLK